MKNLSLDTVLPEHDLFVWFHWMSPLSTRLRHLHLAEALQGVLQRLRLICQWPVSHFMPWRPMGEWSGPLPTLRESMSGLWWLRTVYQVHGYQGLLQWKLPGNLCWWVVSKGRLLPEMPPSLSDMLWSGSSRLSLLPLRQVILEWYLLHLSWRSLLWHLCLREMSKMSLGLQVSNLKVGLNYQQ